VAVSAHAGGSFQTLEPSTERTIVVPFSALRRFFVRVAVLTAVIGVPATLATFVISNRQTPVYLAEATLLAPTAQSSSSPAFDLLEQPLPSESEPLMPEAYGSALTSFDVLQDAWRRLHPNDGEPTPQQLRGLADSVDFRFDTLRRSTLVVVGAEGSTPVEAIARANSVSEALVAWDDSRARAEAGLLATALQAQLDALEEQLASLRAIGSRANLPQIAGISVLTSSLRQDIAAATAGAVGARGSLEFLRPAPGSTQIEPSPVVDAMIVFVLIAVLVTATLLVRGGLDRKLNGVAALTDFTGLPVLADLTKAPAAATTKRRDFREVHFLKAHVDRLLPEGGDLLVVSLRGDSGVAMVAAALDRLYSDPGSKTMVKAGPPLLSSGDAVESVAFVDAVLLVVGARKTDRSDLSRGLSWLRRAGKPVLGMVATSDAGRLPRGRA